MNYIITCILSIIGIIVGIITKLEIEEEILKRCTFSKEESKLVKIIFTFMNIGCVVYMTIVGIILYMKERNYSFFWQDSLCSFFQQ